MSLYSRPLCSASESGTLRKSGMLGPCCILLLGLMTDSARPCGVDALLCITRYTLISMRYTAS